MKKIFFILTMACCVIMWLMPVIYAANHALVIGVGTYPGLPKKNQLEGPVNDVQSIKDMLEKSGFSSEQIVTLSNAQATRKNILKAMNDLKHSSKAGDFIFIYFSGHGTSSYDKTSQDWGIDPFTGGILAWDFRHSKDIGQMMSQLIIGKRDIRPILQELEKERQILVIFDTCYSQDIVRTLKDKGKSKYIDLGLEELIDDDDESPDYYANTIKEPPYPYKNVVYIASSSRREKAIDITKWDILSNGIKTIDGKPHGAMTDELIRGFQGAADGNHDGIIIYNELYQYLRYRVPERFPHTPQILYPPGNFEILAQAVFQGSVAEPRMEPIPEILDPDTSFKIKLKGLTDNLEKRIKAIPGVNLSDKNYDLFITKDNGEYALYLGNGVILTTIPQSESDELIERIRRQVQVKELIHLSFPKQSFNLFLDLIEPKGVLTEGDDIGFNIHISEDSHILLINIDPKGLINVIYPFEAKELGVVKASQGLRFPDLCKVVAPNFGTEYIKAFAFKSMPENLKEFLCKEHISPTSPDFDKLMKMVTSPGCEAAQATIQFKTCKKNR